MFGMVVEASVWVADTGAVNEEADGMVVIDP
jgi:hypothetical protein